MKILAIRGENIASLEGAFEIDFTQEPLSSAGIFAISGPTGAGKSTLLDTMCLALFGCTPRTEQARENKVRLQDVNDEQLAQSDPRFLLRRGTASGYAEVDFVAIDGHRFRARWAVARAREKENGRLKQAQLSLWDLEKGEENRFFLPVNSGIRFPWFLLRFLLCLPCLRTIRLKYVPWYSLCSRRRDCCCF